jgi:hypothetical protein
LVIVSLRRFLFGDNEKSFGGVSYWVISAAGFLVFAIIMAVEGQWVIAGLLTVVALVAALQLSRLLR